MTTERDSAGGGADSATINSLRNGSTLDSLIPPVLDFDLFSTDIVSLLQTDHVVA